MAAERHHQMNEQTQCQMGAEEKDWLSPEEG
jgi:hypothetical protein